MTSFLNHQAIQSSFCLFCKRLTIHYQKSSDVSRSNIRHKLYLENKQKKEGLAPEMTYRVCGEIG